MVELSVNELGYYLAIPNTVIRQEVPSKTRTIKAPYTISLQRYCDNPFSYLMTFRANVPYLMRRQWEIETVISFMMAKLDTDIAVSVWSWGPIVRFYGP